MILLDEQGSIGIIIGSKYVYIGNRDEFFLITYCGRRKSIVNRRCAKSELSNKIEDLILNDTRTN